MDGSAGHLDDGIAFEEVAASEEGFAADVARGGGVGAVAEDFFVGCEEEGAEEGEFVDGDGDASISFVHVDDRFEFVA